LRAAFQASQILLRLRAEKSYLEHDKIQELTMFTRFTYHFFYAIWRVKAVILALIALVVAGAVAVTLIEKMPFGDTLYFAFVTGLTIGYGDIVVKTPFGRLVALLIGFIGILFTGLIVAILVFAVRESLEEFRNRS
jgi:uncharacterized membrane protein